MKNLVKLTALILFCSNAFAHGFGLEVYQPALYPTENGKFVRIPATTGGIIGSIPGFFIGIPVGLAGGLVTSITDGKPSEGFYLGVIGSSVVGAQIVGTVVGAPFWLLRTVFYDAPKKIFSSSPGNEVNNEHIEKLERQNEMPQH